MQLAVRSILIQNGLPAATWDEDARGFDFHFTDRCEPHDIEGTRQSTIYVTAPWAEGSTDMWYDATKQLKIWADDFLDSHNMENVNLSVEIICNELIAPKYVALVPPRPDWRAGWPKVRMDIQSILQSFESSKNQWNCVALIKFGPNKEAKLNPPTVYISLAQACDEGSMARAIHPAIQAYLDKTPFGWQLHLEHGIPDSAYAFPLLPLSRVYEELQIPGEYQSKINLGGNMSASRFIWSLDDNRNHNPIVGTLGCYVELKMKGVWSLYGLTNYHVIRHTLPGARLDAQNLNAPVMGSALYRADHEGFKPGTFPDAQVESPSRASHNATLQWHDLQIEKDGPAVQEEKEARARKVRFFDEGKHIMGHVWAGSGFGRRTRENGILDWALIKVQEERIGLNVLPDVDAWPRSMPKMNVPPKTIWGKELGEVVRRGQSLISESPAFKYGVVTKGRTAVCSEYKVGVVTSERRYMANEDPLRYGATVEPMFVPVENDEETEFAAPGDSGSIVYNGEGQALGLLFRGNPRTHLAYVTPLNDVFDDIKAFSEDKVTDVRIAVFTPQEKGPQQKGNTEGSPSKRRQQ